MIEHCPHCQKTLQFSDAQREKIVQALNTLASGKRITIKCPHCQAGIAMTGSAETTTNAATLQPPAPPDLAWLQTGLFEGEEKVEDVPMALVLFADTPARQAVVDAMKSVGYQVVTADTADEAMQRMQFVSFSCVALHSELEGGLQNSIFHSFMREMAMDRRRYIFYVLIGPEFHSIYNLQALATSANLVVNEKDLKYFDVILRKAIPAYEELFGPMLEEMANYGKR